MAKGTLQTSQPPGAWPCLKPKATSVPPYCGSPDAVVVVAVDCVVDVVRVVDFVVVVVAVLVDVVVAVIVVTFVPHEDNTTDTTISKLNASQKIPFFIV